MLRVNGAFRNGRAVLRRQDMTSTELSHSSATNIKSETHEGRQAQRKEKVEKTFWDTDFFQDSTIEELEDRWGDASPAYYMRIVLRILREGGAIRYESAISILKKRDIKDNAQAFLIECIGMGLFYRDGDSIRSKRADREIDQLSSKRDKWREKKKRFPKDSPENPLRFSGDSEKEKEQEKEKEVEKDQEKENEKTSEGTGTLRDVQAAERREPGQAVNGSGALGSPHPMPQAHDNTGSSQDPPADTPPYAAEAERALEPLDETTTDGRRRLKKYPLCRITAPKLADALGILLDEYGIPPDKLKLVFRMVNAHIEKAQKRGENVDVKYCVYSLLIGWPAQEVLKALRESNYHEKSMQSLNGAHK